MAPAPAAVAAPAQALAPAPEPAPVPVAYTEEDHEHHPDEEGEEDHYDPNTIVEQFLQEAEEELLSGANLLETSLKRKEELKGMEVRLSSGRGTARKTLTWSVRDDIKKSELPPQND